MSLEFSQLQLEFCAACDQHLEAEDVPDIGMVHPPRMVFARCAGLLLLRLSDDVLRVQVDVQGDAVALEVSSPRGNHPAMPASARGEPTYLKLKFTGGLESDRVVMEIELGLGESSARGRALLEQGAVAENRGLIHLDPGLMRWLGFGVKWPAQRRGAGAYEVRSLGVADGEICVLAWGLRADALESP